MAKILTTKGSAAALEDLIRKAESELYLISFSFIISDAFMLRIKQAIERNVIINIVYGKSIKNETMDQLRDLANVKIFSVENLHAKIYANETNCIIGSMNFSEVSEHNNTELGVLLTSQTDTEAFNDARDHCKEIVANSKLVRPMLPKSIADKNKIKNLWGNLVTYNQNKTPLGFCIRTRARIPLDHKRPFCHDAYVIWNQWGDVNHKEDYDHFTGENTFGRTSMAKPILEKNLKDYQKAKGYSTTF